jgi:putative transposase
MSRLRSKGSGDIALMGASPMPPRLELDEFERFGREGNGYPSDLRDAEWARLEPLIPKGSSGGRPRKTDMRAAMNAILYLLCTGCPWRYLPRDSFPPRSTVYNIFRKFQRDGVWESIWAELHMALRERMGREASPSAAVLDSQSVKSAEKGR